ncbi:hypothetical protein GHT09_002514 [Marmota monax]|uniref:Uncharacterized protein n=1 Tax=Marmota monax TaxID=9995 RepID=A0A834V9D7_MARMO|nr:hypothetical protein GHT09_002514 [Marmota monax]
MAPLAEVGGFLGGLEGLGQQVGSHFLLPPAGERPPLLGERRGAAERGARGGPGSAEPAHLHGILRRRQLYCRTGFHLQILPDGSVQGTRQDHSLFGRYWHPASVPQTWLLFPLRLYLPPRLSRVSGLQATQCSPRPIQRKTQAEAEGRPSSGAGRTFPICLHLQPLAGLKLQMLGQEEKG